jgi:hypothetical protein
MEVATKAFRFTALISWVFVNRYSLLLALLATALCLPYLFRTDSEWMEVYVKAAGRLIDGDNLFQDGYLYPPFQALIAVPWTAISLGLGRCLWFAINATALACMVRWAWLLAGGECNPNHSREIVAAFLGLACALPYLLNCLAHQQTDVLIGCLLMAGCLLFSRSRTFAAATCWGLAAACKCTPLLWAPYLVYRRKVWPATWLVCVGLAVNILPDLIAPPANGQIRLVEYYRNFLRPMSANQHYDGTWGSDLVYNQSLAGFGQRLLAHRLEYEAGDYAVRPMPQAAQPITLRFLLVGAAGVLLAGTLLGAGRPFHMGSPGDRSFPLEAAAVLSLMLLLSPMSSKAHFGTLLLPAFCLARAALQPGSRQAKAFFLPALALAWFANKDLLGSKLYTLALFYGVATVQTLVLLIGSLLLLWQMRHAEAGRQLGTEKSISPTELAA